MGRSAGLGRVRPLIRLSGLIYGRLRDSPAVRGAWAIIWPVLSCRGLGDFAGLSPTVLPTPKSRMRGPGRVFAFYPWQTCQTCQVPLGKPFPAWRVPGVWRVAWQVLSDRHDPYVFPRRGMERRSGKPTGFRTAWRSWLRRAGVRRLLHSIRTIRASSAGPIKVMTLGRNTQAI